MQGHIRSILPQKGGVAPIDNNTVAFFDYDNDAKDSVHGIRPIGNRHALHFRGVESDYVDFGNPSLQNLTNCTVDFWCKTDNPAKWLLFGGQSNSYYVMAISETGSFYHSNAGVITVYVDGEPGTQLLRDGEWHHYAAVGVDFSAWTQFDMNNYGSWPLHGSLENMRVWNQVLSVEEIKNLSEGMPGVNTSTLHAFWKMNEAEGNIAYDFSGNGHDGVINGCEWTGGRATYSLEEHTVRKGVLVEEETVNLMPGDASTSSHVSEISPSFGFSKARKIEIGASEYGYMGLSPNIPAKPNTAYSLSYYARLISGKTISGTQMYIGSDTQGTSGVAIAHIQDEIGSEWQRFSISGSTDAAATLITRAAMRVQSDATGCVVEVADWQLEEKPYATSFTRENRGKSFLRYPNPIEGASIFTVSMWVKLTSLAMKSSVFCISPPDQTSQSGIWIDGYSGTWRAFTYPNDTGGAKVINSARETKVGEWVFLTVTRDTSQLSFYIDGKLENSTSDVAALNLGNTVSLGKRMGNISDAANCIIDELRIDKVARTAEEIQAWYHHGREAM